MAALHAGRKTRAYRKARAEVLAASTVCWLCGHEGAGSVDHEPPLTELRRLGWDPDDPRFLRPAHGALSRCPVCAKACNEAKGAGEHRPQVIRSRAW